MNRLVIFALGAAAWACSDELSNPIVSDDELVVVVNSTENSLTVFAVNDPARTDTIPLGTANASPVSLDARGSLVAVPLGTAHAVALVDLRTAGVMRTVPLAQGSGATGAAFESDSVLWVANPGLNTVTRVSVSSGDTASLAVGRYPQALVVVGDELWVLSVNLVQFEPAGPGWFNVVDLPTRSVTDSVPLSGSNSQFAVLADDGLIYVVHSGRFGQSEGRLSLVDPAARAELIVVQGLGEFPGQVADDLRRGRLLIASINHGLMVFDRDTRRLTAGPGEGLLLDEEGFASVTLDSSGRIYAVQHGDCVNPGRVRVLRADLSEIRTVPTGACPFAVAATRLEP